MTRRSDVRDYAGRAAGAGGRGGYRVVGDAMKWNVLAALVCVVAAYVAALDGREAVAAVDAALAALNGACVGFRLGRRKAWLL